MVPLPHFLVMPDLIAVAPGAAAAAAAARLVLECGGISHFAHIVIQCLSAAMQI